MVYRDCFRKDLASVNMIYSIVCSPLDFLSGQPSRLILILSLTALSGHVTLNIIIAPVVFNLNQIAAHILTGTLVH